MWSFSKPWHAASPGLPFSTHTANPKRRWRLIVVCVAISIIVCWAGSLVLPDNHPLKIAQPTSLVPSKWQIHKEDPLNYKVRVGQVKKPDGIKLIGLVFYGRRSRVEILDCYLQRNLVRNGGLFDEVHFVIQTSDMEDLEWVFNLISRTPGYKKIVPQDKFNMDNRNFGGGYGSLQRNTLYLKIDDDVVFIGENTVAEMLRVKLAHPEYFMISANTVNNPRTSYIHQHIDAVQAFLPELTPQAPATRPGSWRTSELPVWAGPDEYVWEPDQQAPASETHRWLPVLPFSSNATRLDFKRSLDRTPIMQTDYDAFGRGWNQWAIAAQQHYSLLAHLEKTSSLPMYELHDVWDMGYDRISINFILFLGDDVLDNGPVPDDDEMYLSSQLPQALGRHSAIAGKAPLAHYAFSIQTEGLERTDVLSRYKAYAEEVVCRRKI